MTSSNRSAARIFFAAATLLGLVACQDAVTSPQVVGPQYAKGGGGIPGGPLDITKCGTVISAPGKYRVAADIACVGDGDGITIASSNVTLHFGGHTLSSSGASSGTGLSVLKADNVSILGPGTVEGFPLGGAFGGTTNSRMSGMTFSDNITHGFAVNWDFPDLTQRSENNQFYDNVFRDNGGQGLTMNGGDNNKFRDNLASGNNGYGFYMYDAVGNDYQGNTSDGNVAGFYTLDPSGSANLIQANEASGNSEFDGAEDGGGCLNTWKANNFGTVSDPVCIH